VWMELLLKLVILCQYNSQIHRVPAGRIVTNKQTIILPKLQQTFDLILVAMLRSAHL
jgi:hypothetical protein